MRITIRRVAVMVAIEMIARSLKRECCVVSKGFRDPIESRQDVTRKAGLYALLDWSLFESQVSILTYHDSS